MYSFFNVTKNFDALYFHGKFDLILMIILIHSLWVSIELWKWVNFPIFVKSKGVKNCRHLKFNHKDHKQNENSMVSYLAYSFKTSNKESPSTFQFICISGSSTILANSFSFSLGEHSSTNEVFVSLQSRCWR